LTWAHPTLRSLEEQALVLMLGTSPVELGLQGHEACVYATLAEDPAYRSLFAEAFLSAGVAITTTNIATALSAFESELLRLFTCVVRSARCF
jgi:cytochrome c peroxidase